jgi:hemolysin III
MVTHIVGGALGIIAFLTCVVVAAYKRNIPGIVSGAVYGFALTLSFTMSSVYHGLKDGLAKRVFQVLDHCSIFVMIAGTYTPIVLNRFRLAYPTDAWIIFGVIWAFAILGITLNSIDLKNYKIFSIACYLGMGWLIVLSAGKVIEILGSRFFLCLIWGGVFYTLGAALYITGKKMKRRYIHSVFHIFVDIAALIHFWGIAAYVIA